ncbi:hypothetical protein [Brevibacterium casei]|uniref:Uncharacterized protein n=1 Tax=Brevibacterium casei TaxID=33889 RepID=A0A7T2WNC7_9MICO|nr:hypothetical protein I6G59_16590 [Brevibacterium casei]
MRVAISAGLLDAVEATVAASVCAETARKWWMAEISRVVRGASFPRCTFVALEAVAQL